MVEVTAGDDALAAWRKRGARGVRGLDLDQFLTRLHVQDA
jgi:hypothetical protein